MLPQRKTWTKLISAWFDLGYFDFGLSLWCCPLRPHLWRECWWVVLRKASYVWQAWAGTSSRSVDFDSQTFLKWGLSTTLGKRVPTVTLGFFFLFFGLPILKAPIQHQVTSLLNYLPEIKTSRIKRQEVVWSHSHLLGHSQWPTVLQKVLSPPSSTTLSTSGPSEDTHINHDTRSGPFLGLTWAGVEGRGSAPTVGRGTQCLWAHATSAANLSLFFRNKSCSSWCLHPSFMACPVPVLATGGQLSFVQTPKVETTAQFKLP